jgi:hypothetical protein
MNPHLRFGLLILGLAGVCAVVLLLRREPAIAGDSTRQFDLLLGVLGAAAAAVVVTYVFALRRRAAVAVAHAETVDAGEPAAPRGLSIERLLGRRIGRVVGILLLGVTGLAVLFLVGLLGYVLYLTLLG